MQVGIRGRERERRGVAGDCVRSYVAPGTSTAFVCSGPGARVCLRDSFQLLAI